MDDPAARYAPQRRLRSGPPLLGLAVLALVVAALAVGTWATIAFFDGSTADGPARLSDDDVSVRAAD